MPMPQLQRNQGKQVTGIFCFYKGMWALPEKKGREMSVGKAAQSEGRCGLAGMSVRLLWTLVVCLREGGAEEHLLIQKLVK